MTEAFRLLKPRGRALVVEWKAHLDSPGPPRSSRIARGNVERLFKQVGFSHFQYIDWTNNHYVVIGNKI